MLGLDCYNIYEVLAYLVLTHGVLGGDAAVVRLGHGEGGQQQQHGGDGHQHGGVTGVELDTENNRHFNCCSYSGRK